MSCAPQCYSLWVLANIRGIIAKFSHVSIFSDIGPSPSRVSLVASCVQAEVCVAIVNVNVSMHNYHNSTTYLTICFVIGPMPSVVTAGKTVVHVVADL